MDVDISWKKKFDSILFHSKALVDAMGNMKAGVSTDQWHAAQKTHIELIAIKNKINWVKVK